MAELVQRLHPWLGFTEDQQILQHAIATRSSVLGDASSLAGVVSTLRRKLGELEYVVSISTWQK